MAGPIPQMFAYLEQQALASSFQFRLYNATSPQPNTYGLYFRDPLNLPQSVAAIATPPTPPGAYPLQPNLKVLTCPSASPGPDGQVAVIRMQGGAVAGRDHKRPTELNPAEGFGSIAAYTSYAVAGAVGVSTQNAYARSNYLAMAGYQVDPPDSYFPGIFHYKSRLPITSITDGTSNTIAFIESVGGYVDTGSPASTGWWGNGAGLNGQNSAFGACPDRTNPNCDFSPQGKGFGYALPSSMHTTNRINCVFGDGSVRNIAATLDFSVYVYICGRDDGEVVTFD